MLDQSKRITITMNGLNGMKLKNHEWEITKLKLSKQILNCRICDDNYGWMGFYCKCIAYRWLWVSPTSLSTLHSTTGLWIASSKHRNEERPNDPVHLKLSGGGNEALPFLSNLDGVNSTSPPKVPMRTKPNKCSLHNKDLFFFFSNQQSQHYQRNFLSERINGWIIRDY